MYIEVSDILNPLLNTILSLNVAEIRCCISQRFHDMVEKCDDCRQSRLSRVATTTATATTATTLADLDCGFSRPAAVRRSAVGLWIIPALPAAVGSWDVDFIWISVVLHKFLAQGSAFGMWISFGFQLYRTNFGPRGRRLECGFHQDFSCTAQIFGPGAGGWDVDFIRISVVPHIFH